MDVTRWPGSVHNIADRVGHLPLILNLGMSGSVPKRVEKRCAGIECNGCNRVFATLFGYDQHRRSVELRGTACWALPDTNRTNLYAVSRPNMSTASLERRPVRRTRGGAKSMQE